MALSINSFGDMDLYLDPLFLPLFTVNSYSINSLGIQLVSSHNERGDRDLQLLILRSNIRYIWDYSWEHYSWCIHESRTGHTSNARINSLSEPAIQCSQTEVSFFYFLPIVHIPTYLVQLVHTMIPPSLWVFAFHALLLYGAQNHSFFLFNSLFTFLVSFKHETVTIIRQVSISLIIIIL